MSNKKSKSGIKKAVRLNDSFHTVIYVDAKESPENAIKKYLKDLEDYKKNGATNFSQGNSKNIRHQV